MATSYLDNPFGKNEKLIGFGMWGAAPRAVTASSSYFLGNPLTTGNNAHGKSVFQFMGLVIGIFSIEFLLSNEIPEKYCRNALVLGEVMRLHEDYRK